MSMMLSGEQMHAVTGGRNNVSWSLIDRPVGPQPMVRESWVRWAETQASPKPSWLVPYEELPEDDKEADRQIGEAIARWTLIGDAARAARSNAEAASHG